MSESALMRIIMLAVSRGATRLFRANAGAGWSGRVMHHAESHITLANPRRFHGMTAGVSDLIGWTTIAVTPDMVGRRIAVFTALEVKAPDGRLRAEQRAFLTAVLKAGGVASVVRSEAEAAGAIESAGRPAAATGLAGHRKASEARARGAAAPDRGAARRGRQRAAKPQLRRRAN